MIVVLLWVFDLCVLVCLFLPWDVHHILLHPVLVSEILLHLVLSYPKHLGVDLHFEDALFMSSSWWNNMFSITFILSISLWYLSMYDVWFCSNSLSVLLGRNSMIHDLKCFSGSFWMLKLCHLIIAFLLLFLMEPRPICRVYSWKILDVIHI